MTEMAPLPGSDVPMTREELRELIADTIYGHARIPAAVPWEIDLLMGAVEQHVALRVEDWKRAAGAGMRLTDELRAERDALAAGVPLVCSDERHKTKVFALQMTLERVHAERDALDRDRERLDKDCESFGDGYADAVARIRLALDPQGSTAGPKETP